MNTKKQYIIELKSKDLKKINPMFNQISKFYNGFTRPLSLSYKVSMHFNKENAFIKKLDDGNYSLHFDVENLELFSILTKDERKMIVKEYEEIIITSDELKEIVSKYNIWLTGNKLRSTDMDALEQFCNKYLKDE